MTRPLKGTKKKPGDAPTKDKTDDAPRHALGERYLRPKDVAAKLGVTKVYIYRLMKLGKFPKSIRLGDHWTVWRESEIDAWVESHKVPERAA